MAKNINTISDKDWAKLAARADKTPPPTRQIQNSLKQQAKASQS